jgi:hypothetical protein
MTSKPIKTEELRKEFIYEVVKPNWHDGAGEIVDFDKFLSESIDWFISKLSQERQREREWFIHILKTTKYGPPYGDLSLSGFIERVLDSLTESEKGEK